MAQYHYMIGRINWAKLLGDPVPNYNRDGNEWTVDFSPDDDGIKLMEELGIDNKLKHKGDERGTFITFKQKELRANGKRNDPVVVCDARNRPWDPEVKIGNDSLGEAKFRVVEYGKGKPVGVYLQALRVLEHKPFVRQEFSPLPEDSKYLQNFSEPVEDFGEDVDEGDPLEG